MSFDSLGLAPALAQAVAEQGYSTPTQIQARAIPEIIAGRDLLGAAQTGTGKTAAFTLPMLHRLRAASAQPVAERQVRALVLVPTRELAMQVAESVRTYGLHLHGLRTVMIFGGVSIRPQIEGLKRGVDVVVATPGRLLDHVGQGTIDLSKVEFLVLDEADRMLDMGFIRDIRKLIERMPRKRQNLLFSATFSPDIRKLAEGLLQDPVTIDIAPRNSAVQSVDQRAVMVVKSDKSALLSYLIGSRNWRQVLVFTRTKHGANRLADRLIRDGIPTAALHGNKSQNARTKALAEFKSGQVRALVATDIAARGIDIDQLPHVVNFELPSVAEDYVHRIGRTGRAGEVGEALSLVCREEQDEWRAIEKLLKRSIEMVQVEGFVPGSGARDPEPERPPRPPQGRHGPRQHAARPGAGGQRAGERRPAGGQPSSRPSGHSTGERPAAGAQPAARRSEGRPQGHAQGRAQGPSRGAAGTGTGPRRGGQGGRGAQGGGRPYGGR